MKNVDRRIRVLFFCPNNDFYSPLAAGIAQVYGGQLIAVSSAGLVPARTINPLTLRLLADLGLEIEDRTPRPLSAFHPDDFDAVVTLGDQAIDLPPPWQEAALVEHWVMPSLEGESAPTQRQLMDEMEEQVRNLVRKLIFGLP